MNRFVVLVILVGCGGGGETMSRRDSCVKLGAASCSAEERCAYYRGESGAWTQTEKQECLQEYLVSCCEIEDICDEIVSVDSGDLQECIDDTAAADPCSASPDSCGAICSLDMEQINYCEVGTPSGDTLKCECLSSYF